MNRRGLLVSANASVNTTTCGAKVESIKSASCIMRCHDTGSKGPMPAGSPASASSISGGSTWPKPTDHVGPGVSNEGTSNAPRAVSVNVAGKVRVVSALNGAKATSIEGSPSNMTRPGV